MTVITPMDDGERGSGWIQDLAALPKPVLAGGVVGAVLVIGLGLALAAHTGGSMQLTSNGLAFVAGA